VPESPRQVIRERSFERDLRALIQDAREASDFVEGAEFVLAQDPEIGSPLDDGIWFLPMAPLGKEQVVLYYAFDESTVTLLAIARLSSVESSEFSHNGRKGTQRDRKRGLRV
jgi:hypothetical protein